VPHVTVYYTMYLTSGHHRQPRNTSSELELAPTGGGDISPGGTISPSFFPTLPYTDGTITGTATCEFWSVTDGTSGQVLAPAAFTQTVGTSPLTITAWYFPTGSGSGSGGTEIIDDAFSANLGEFIDDTFVDVTSDPSLTSQANVVGIVPTGEAETLKAYVNVVSTTEPFSRWVMNGTFMMTGDTTLNVPQGTQGIAVAIYQNPPSSRPPVTVPPPSIYNPWWWIQSWWGVGPDGPEWVQQLGAAVQLGAAAKNVSPQLRARVLQMALQQVTLAASTLENEISEAEG
jgi:hypothetical protein